MLALARARGKNTFPRRVQRGTQLPTGPPLGRPHLPVVLQGRRLHKPPVRTVPVVPRVVALVVLRLRLRVLGVLGAQSLFFPLSLSLCRLCRHYLHLLDLNYRDRVCKVIPIVPHSPGDLPHGIVVPAERLHSGQSKPFTYYHWLVVNGQVD